MKTCGLLCDYCLRQGAYVFGPVCLLERLSVCQWDYGKKTTSPIFMKLGVACAMEEPIRFWSGSESQDRNTDCFSLSLTLRDRKKHPDLVFEGGCDHTRAEALLWCLHLPPDFSSSPSPNTGI